ncbi:MAG: hypothetical protein GTO60_08130, partial [Gammaproteobacteria bacterium]|nr:hypothetical protein [Gammaproteobacteria bacterium]
MYKQIRKHPGVRQKYIERLISENLLTQADAENITKSYIHSLESNKIVAGQKAENIVNDFLIDFSPYQGKHWNAITNTTVDP